MVRVAGVTRLSKMVRVVRVAKVVTTARVIRVASVARVAGVGWVKVARERVMRLAKERMMMVAGVKRVKRVKSVCQGNHGEGVQGGKDKIGSQGSMDWSMRVARATKMVRIPMYCGIRVHWHIRCKGQSGFLR